MFNDFILDADCRLCCNVCVECDQRHAWSLLGVRLGGLSGRIDLQVTRRRGVHGTSVAGFLGMQDIEWAGWHARNLGGKVPWRARILGGSARNVGGTVPSHARN